MLSASHLVVVVLARKQGVAVAVASGALRVLVKAAAPADPPAAASTAAAASAARGGLGESCGRAAARRHVLGLHDLHQERARPGETIPNAAAAAVGRHGRRQPAATQRIYADRAEPPRAAAPQTTQR
jgi:hypothetical protein